MRNYKHNVKLVKDKYLETVNFMQLRIPKPSKVSMRTIFFSIKLNMNIEYEKSMNYKFENKFGGESHLEDVLIILAEQSPIVLDYLPQSMPKNQDGTVDKLSYSWNNTTYEWIPDICMVINNNGILETWIIEVKPIHFLTKKTVRQKLTVKYEFAKQICYSRGWKFHLFTDIFKKVSWRFENVYDLRSQLRWIDPKIKKQLLKQLNEEKILKIKDIIASKFKFRKSMIRSALYELIYDEELFIDQSKPLNDNTNVMLKFDKNKTLIQWLQKFNFENREKYLDESIDIELNKSKTKWEREYEKQINIILQLYREGKSYRQICKIVEEKLAIQISKSKVGRIIQDSQHGLLKSIPIRGKKGVAGPNKTKLFTVNDNGKPEFSDTYFKNAVQSFESPFKIIKKDAWKIYYVKLRLDYAATGIVESTSSIPELLEKIPEMASKYVFQNNLKEYINYFENKVASKREGYKKANKYHRDVRGRTPHKSYIGQTVEIDHTPVDIIPVVNPANYLRSLNNTRYKLENMPRATLTIAIDRHSRAIVGYALRFNSASSETNHLVLRRTMLGNVSPLYSDTMKKLASTKEKIKIGYTSLYNRGIIADDTYFGTLNLIESNIGKLADWYDNIRVIPHTLAMDNGTDFTSKQLAYLGNKLKIDFNYRPVGGSNYGGIVERNIKTINYDAFHNLPGTTKGTIEQKGDMNPDDFKILKFEELEAVLLLKLLEYHIEPHTGLDALTPKIKWDEGIENGHVIYPKYENTKERNTFYRKIAFETLPTLLNNHGKIPPYHENKGLVSSNIWYNYIPNSLNSEDKAWSYIYSKGDKIEVKQSKDDVRFVYWYNEILDKVVRVWATEIRVDGVQYTGRNLESLPPISLNQIKDELALTLLDNYSALKENEKYLAELENIRVSTTYDMIQKTGSKKKNSKVVAQNEEKHLQQIKESVERNQQFNSQSKKEVIATATNKRRNRKSRKIKWDKIPKFPNIDEEDSL